MRVLRIVNTTATAWGLPASRAHSHAVPRVLRSVGAECQAGKAQARAMLKAIELSGVAPSRADVLAAVEKILAAPPPL